MKVVIMCCHEFIEQQCYHMLVPVSKGSKQVYNAFEHASSHQESGPIFKWPYSGTPCTTDCNNDHYIQTYTLQHAHTVAVKLVTIKSLRGTTTFYR